MLNPKLPIDPNYLAGQAISTLISPDKKTLLVLTSGFNRYMGPDGKPVASASNEYVFVYDLSDAKPRKTQILEVPNTFAGIAFSPDGLSFYVSGGADDNVHTYSLSNNVWTEKGGPIKLSHKAGLGFDGKGGLTTGGVAVTRDGKLLVVTNVYNDSVSIIDIQSRKVIKEIDLRPGRIDPMQKSKPGGEYPFWVAIKGNDTAYVSSIRDREIVAIRLRNFTVSQRIKLAGNPNKMILNASGTRLYIAEDNTDTVSVIDTATDQLVEKINVVGPAEIAGHLKHYTSAAPNGLALSPDERTLYVTDGGLNAVSVVNLGRGSEPSRVRGLIPTAWYPNDVSAGADGRTLYIANGKTVPGPNPDLNMKLMTDALHAGPAVVVNSKNQYIDQLEKASLLTAPVPDERELDRLTHVVAANNSFNVKADAHEQAVMRELRQRIKHVIYIIKENRTYDQVLGDLDRGNGDPKLTEFGERITPNFHALARQFVDLDNFYNSGEVSGDGWPWSTSGREADFSVKTIPMNYAQRGTQYESEGTNRDINVGLATQAERKAANPKTPDDPDLLPGAINVVEPDGPEGSAKGKGYIWDAVLRKGLSFREYGCMSDGTNSAPREPYPFKANLIVSRPSNPELYRFGDPYFRGFDPGYPDFYREAEWEREFEGYVAHKNLPAFEILTFPVDHMGDFDTAISGVNTPELQQADNDYGTARLIQRVAHSPYRDSTLIFILEDDSQDGPDHVDAHRSTAYVVGPYVKHGAVVSHYYTTVNMVRTMEDVMGLDHLNLNTATERPMTDIFDLNQKEWTFDAKPSELLRKTKLPITQFAKQSAGPISTPAHDNTYWAKQTVGFDFSREDRIDSDRFNRIVWNGLMNTEYPDTRSGQNLREGR